MKGASNGHGREGGGGGEGLVLAYVQVAYITKSLIKPKTTLYEKVQAPGQKREKQANEL